MKAKNKPSKTPGSWYFLATILAIYLALAIFKQNIFSSSLAIFNDIILKVIPVIILVFVLMTLSNRFITNELVIKHLKGKGIKKWVFVIIGGVLSSGPIYMWYPLLSDLKKKGLGNGLIACFLYNRSIKIPVLPLAIVYFSWKYIITLTLVMIAASILQGILISKLIPNQQ